MIYLIIFAIALFAALGAWGSRTRKNFSILQDKAAETKTLIRNKLKLRYEALLNMFNEASDCMPSTEKNIIQRARVDESMEIDELNASALLMDKAAEKINAFSEAYPSIKTSPAYNNFSSSIIQIENELNTLYQTYNHSVTLYNSMLEKFPTSFFGKDMEPLTLFKH